LELYRGESLTPAQLDEVKCHNKWNTLRKSFAVATGTRYVPSSVVTAVKAPLAAAVKPPRQRTRNNNVRFGGSRTRRKTVKAAASPLADIAKVLQFA
jgi:hypothetical protein